MRAEEREDALAGIVRRGLLVSGSDEPAQDREQDRRLVCGAFGSVHAASLGRRISAGHEPGADYCCARRTSSTDPVIPRKPLKCPGVRRTCGECQRQSTLMWSMHAKSCPGMYG